MGQNSEKVHEVHAISAENNEKKTKRRKTHREEEKDKDDDGNTTEILCAHRTDDFNPSKFAGEVSYSFQMRFKTMLRDDYLVVSLSCILAQEDFSRLEYFSLKDNKWKEIENTHFPYTLDKIDPRVGSLYNDAIHWLALHSDSLMEVIIAFDLIERKLFEMPFPNDVEHKSDRCELWIFGEFLSLWGMDCENRRIEIWVMKEYNVHSSWIKGIVLSLNILPPHKFSPICSTKNGDINEILCA
ncbi:F-box/kelch-repeat protein At3g06240-like [Vicia villosa]|uniref:F-box/kelch-repeat protein At3g06240-like n=1 Tax=Vicia villosa TaxID=3911 RepID=UPI00273B3236|nr:F-box/kelch-repeat protein At3g06240-like [Vicia villosa]